MKYLLDTHIWLWSLLEPDKLAREIKEVLLKQDNDLFISPHLRMGDSDSI